MFQISIISLMIFALVIIIKASSSKNNPKNIVGPLIAPFFIYCMIILYAKDKNGYFINYADQQLFTLSLGFFSIYSMMTIFVLRKFSCR